MNSLNKFKSFKPSAQIKVSPTVVATQTTGGPTVKLVPLGGVGDVTKNMYVYETDKDLIIVDCGVGFPDEGMLGVDLVIPDITYLADKKSKLRGIVITHGHEDHIGSLPFLWPSLNCPIYARKLPSGFLKVKFAEHHLPKDIVTTIDLNSTLDLGDFHLSFYQVSHSVPDCMGLIIDTPAGRIIHQSDFKLDWTPVNGQLTDLGKLADAGKEKEVLLMLIDGLRSERKGFSHSEQPIQAAIEAIEQKTEGKLVVTMTSSNITRMQQVINLTAKAGRRLAIVGRSMDNNFQTARDLGYLQIPPGLVVPAEEIKRFSDKSLTLIISGSQGQPGSSLSRAANNDHRFVRLKKGDSVVFSADPIPLSTLAYYGLIDKLARMGIETYYSDITDNLHTSGHASSEEIKLMIQLAKPKYVMPIGTTFRGMKAFERLMRDLDYQDDKIMTLYEQKILNLTPGKVAEGEELHTKNVYVDGLGVGDVGSVVLRDRQVMAEEGIVLVIVPIDAQSGKLGGDIDVISRGVVFEKESEELLGEVKGVAQSALSDHQDQVLDWRFARRHIEESLEKFFYQRMHRRPMILPVVVEV